MGALKKSCCQHWKSNPWAFSSAFNDWTSILCLRALVHTLTEPLTDFLVHRDPNLFNFFSRLPMIVAPTLPLGCSTSHHAPNIAVFQRVQLFNKPLFKLLLKKQCLYLMSQTAQCLIARLHSLSQPSLTILGFGG